MSKSARPSLLLPRARSHALWEARAELVTQENCLTSGEGEITYTTASRPNISADVRVGCHVVEIEPRARVPAPFSHLLSSGLKKGPPCCCGRGHGRSTVWAGWIGGDALIRQARRTCVHVNSPALLWTGTGHRKSKSSQQRAASSLSQDRTTPAQFSPPSYLLTALAERRTRWHVFLVRKYRIRT